MLVTETETSGFKFCAGRVTDEFGNEDTCSAYDTMLPATLVIIERKSQYKDRGDGGPGATVEDQMINELVEYSDEYIRFADHEANVVCAACGQRTMQPTTRSEHVHYDRLSGQHPKTLLRMRGEELETSRRTADAQGDLAASLAAMVREMQLGREADQGRIADLEARLFNGHEAPAGADVDDAQAEEAPGGQRPPAPRRPRKA